MVGIGNDDAIFFRTNFHGTFKEFFKTVWTRVRIRYVVRRLIIFFLFIYLYTRFQEVIVLERRTEKSIVRTHAHEPHDNYCYRTYSELTNRNFFCVCYIRVNIYERKKNHAPFSNLKRVMSILRSTTISSNNNNIVYKTIGLFFNGTAPSRV